MIHTILETERLMLRELDDNDFDALCAMLQDPRVMYAWERTFSDDEVRSWIARMRKRYREDGFAYWAAVEKASGAVIGQTDCSRRSLRAIPTSASATS